MRAHDPEAMTAATAVLPGVIWFASAYEAAEGAGVTALLTEWNAYRALDLKKIVSLMTGNVLIDLRNVYKAEDIEGTGFDYRSVGNPTAILKAAESPHHLKAAESPHHAIEMASP
ncbi:UDP binding domain-containing protein [Phyllobacterium salinisoli]|uniref:UDP binding domain-containing protein n=1 Tax=Phyllobacterium salinisoli TaxID=1899321 RepID=UPI0026C24982